MLSSNLLLHIARELFSLTLRFLGFVFCFVFFNKKRQTPCLTWAFLEAKLILTDLLPSHPHFYRVVDLLTLAASLKTDSYSQSNKLGHQTWQQKYTFPYCNNYPNLLHSNLNSNYFVKIISKTLLWFSVFGEKITYSCLKILNEFINREGQISIQVSFL